MVLTIHDRSRGDDGRYAHDGDRDGDLRCDASTDEQRFETRHEAAEVGAAKQPALEALRRFLEPGRERSARPEDERLDRAL